MAPFGRDRRVVALTAVEREAALESAHAATIAADEAVFKAALDRTEREVARWAAEAAAVQVAADRAGIEAGRRNEADRLAWLKARDAMAKDGGPAQF